MTDHLIQSLSGLITALTGFLALVINRRVTKLKKGVNGRMEELIEMHRTEAFREGWEAAKGRPAPAAVIAERREESSAPTNAG